MFFNMRTYKLKLITLLFLQVMNNRKKVNKERIFTFNV